MQYDTKGHLEVFVILGKDDDSLYGICEDLDTVKKQVEIFKKFGTSDFKFAKYKVKRLTDFD